MVSAIPPTGEAIPKSLRLPFRGGWIASESLYSDSYIQTSPSVAETHDKGAVNSGKNVHGCCTYLIIGDERLQGFHETLILHYNTESGIDQPHELHHH